jgi:hypothetical protein
VNVGTNFPTPKEFLGTEIQEQIKEEENEVEKKNDDIDNQCVINSSELLKTKIGEFPSRFVPYDIVSVSKNHNSWRIIYTKKWRARGLVKRKEEEAENHGCSLWRCNCETLFEEHAKGRREKKKRFTWIRNKRIGVAQIPAREEEEEYPPKKKTNTFQGFQSQTISSLFFPFSSNEPESQSHRACGPRFENKGAEKAS